MFKEGNLNVAPDNKREESPEDKAHREAAERFESLNKQQVFSRPLEDIGKITAETEKKEKRNQMISDLDKVWAETTAARQEIDKMHNLAMIDIEKIKNTLMKLDEEIGKDRTEFIGDKEIESKVTKLVTLRDYISGQGELLEKAA